MLIFLYNFHREDSLLKINNKNVIAENQCEKHKKSSLSTLKHVNVCSKLSNNVRYLGIGLSLYQLLFFVCVEVKGDETVPMYRLIRALAAIYAISFKFLRACLCLSLAYKSTQGLALVSNMYCQGV